MILQEMGFKVPEQPGAGVFEREDGMFRVNVFRQFSGPVVSVSAWVKAAPFSLTPDSQQGDIELRIRESKRAIINALQAELEK